MFLIIIDYIEPVEVIDKYLKEHRKFLEECYKNNFFIVAGPKNPRDGGIILSQLTDRQKLNDVLKNDPFIINNLISYKIIEFNPVKYHVDFSVFVKS